MAAGSVQTVIDASVSKVGCGLAGMAAHRRFGTGQPFRTIPCPPWVPPTSPGQPHPKTSRSPSALMPPCRSVSYAQAGVSPVLGGNSTGDAQGCRDQDLRSVRTPVRQSQEVEQSRAVGPDHLLLEALPGNRATVGCTVDEAVRPTQGVLRSVLDRFLRFASVDPPAWHHWLHAAGCDSGQSGTDHGRSLRHRW